MRSAAGWLAIAARISSRTAIPASRLRAACARNIAKIPVPISSAVFISKLCGQTRYKSVKPVVSDFDELAHFFGLGGIYGATDCRGLEALTESGEPLEGFATFASFGAGNSVPRGTFQRHITRRFALLGESRDRRRRRAVYLGIESSSWHVGDAKRLLPLMIADAG
jgi:hypothetical protein